MKLHCKGLCRAAVSVYLFGLGSSVASDSEVKIVPLVLSDHASELKTETNGGDGLSGDFITL